MTDPRDLLAISATPRVLQTCTHSAASEEVICGPGGVLEGVHPGLTLIDMASIAPEMSRSIAARAKALGVPVLDAPVTGAPRLAAEGKLGIMVGGPREIFEACVPIFETLGVKIVYDGGISPRTSPPTTCTRISRRH